MRRRGTCYEVIGMRPHDHIGWVFEDRPDFDLLARRFLSEGSARGELLMLVVENPETAVVDGLEDTVTGRPVQVASLAEVYGPSGVVDPEGQRATFAGVLNEALAAGYSGIRVAADNTPLVMTRERLDAWMRWESVADRFMSENPVTGLCAFDRHRVDVDQLRHLATLHPLVSASTPTPQFRLYAYDEGVWVEGLLDTFAIGQIAHALGELPAKTPLVVDLANVTVASDRVFTSLAALSDGAIDVTVQGPRDLVAAARRAVPEERRHLHFLEI